MSSSSSHDSSPLFTPPGSPRCSSVDVAVASCDNTSATVPGLFYLPDFLTDDEAERVIEDISRENYFDVQSGRDQAVLFANVKEKGQGNDVRPSWTERLLLLVADRLARHETFVPKEVAQLLLVPDPSVECTRQFILNCYQPGQGIAAHIDLPHQFLDGIMIFSFGSGIAMDFENIKSGNKHSVYLTPRSLCILSGESRWQWTHGIIGRQVDQVWNERLKEDVRIRRGQRLSITVRWYKLQIGEIKSCN